MQATITQCVILQTDFRPCFGRPLLFWLLREFSRYGVTDFLLQAGDAASREAVGQIQAMLPRPIRISFALGSDDAGTGGALLQARSQLQERFLLCSGRQLFDHNLASLLAEAAAGHPSAVGHTDGHVCVFQTALLEHLRPVCSLETAVLPALTASGLLPGDATRATSPSGDPPNPLRRRALFLDRDGVINIDHGYVGSPDRFEWVDGALKAIRHATAAGWHVFIVTNQSGVARGLFSEAAVGNLLDWIAAQARAEGGTIDDVRFCPFHSEATVPRYRQAHPWRKPLPGMLLDLMRAWELDAGRAVMIGDQPTDMAAAAAAGVAGYLFPGGDLLGFLRPILASR